MSFLGVNEHGIGCFGLNFPFPPVAAFSAYAVRGVESLEHEAFGVVEAGCLVEVVEVLDGGGVEVGGDEDTHFVRGGLG